MAATGFCHKKFNQLFNALLICDGGDLILNAFDLKAIQLSLKVWQELALTKNMKSNKDQYI